MRANGPKGGAGPEERSEDPLRTPDVELAQHGDRAAFDRLFEPLLPRLRSLVRRMVGDPQDTADLVQDTLLRAYEKLGTFRGDSKLSTWLFTIATRKALDHLASHRVRADAKVRLRELVHDDPALWGEFRGFLVSEQFDAREHIAFCFGCVARSLPPEQQAALVLRDIFDLDNDEAARVLDVTTSVLRHHLADARAGMEERYTGLCRLVSKTGVCYQCDALREAFPEPRRGPAVPEIGDMRKRLAVVRQADPDTGATQRFHDFLWRALAVLESQ